jgi:hypothetical protein
MKINKIISIFLLVVTILIFSPYSLDALGLPPIMEQLNGGEVLMDPGVGTVCFNAKRPNLNFNKAESVEPVIITGNCPFDSGCDLIRVLGGGALNYVLTGAPEAIEAVDFVDLHRHLPKGDVNITIQEHGLSSHKLYFYYGRGTGNFGPTVIQEMGTGGITGVANSQQLGQINEFNFSATPPPGGTQQSCTFVAWDPFGRVFDSVSLEPIPNIKVTLIDNATKKPAVMLFEKNNDITLVDGLFNILVEKEGMYQLSLDLLATHQFIANPTLNSNYSKIYYDLYHPGNIFEEKKGIPTHHDIPLQPIGNPYIAPKVEIMKIETAINMSASTLYKGRVSHPFAKVCLTGEITKKEYGCVGNSDKFGIYQIILSNENIPLDEKLIPVGIKVDLNSVSITQKIQQSIKIDSLVGENPEEKNIIPGYEPIFSHVEGFAYDEKGTVIPKAKIDVILKTNNKIVYTTYTDDRGFFTIYSKNLPIFEYYLQIIPPGSKEAIHQTTSQFAKANESYVMSERLNFLSAKKNNQPIVNPATGSLNNIITTSNYLKGTTTIKRNIFNVNLLLISAVLIVLIIVTLGIVFHIKKSRG